MQTASSEMLAKLKKIRKIILILAVALFFGLLVIWIIVFPSYAREAFFIIAGHVISTAVVLVALDIVLRGIDQLHADIREEATLTKISDLVANHLREQTTLQQSQLEKFDVGALVQSVALARFKGISHLTDRFDHAAFEGSCKDPCDIRIMNTWVPEWDFIEPLLRKSLLAGRSVWLLLANYKGSFAEARDHTLEHDVIGRIRGSYEQIKTLYTEIGDEFKPNLKLKTYSGAPPCTLYVAGEDVQMGLYAVKKLAIERIQFSFRKGSEFGLVIWPEFEALWEQRKFQIELAKPIDDFPNPEF